MNIIVAVAHDFAIGYKGELLLRISTDLKRFRAYTTGNVVVMGYNTLLSLPGGKPLKNRTNIVLYPEAITIDDAIVVHDIPGLLEELKKYDIEKIFIIGGGSVYRQLLPYCDTAYITKIDRSFEADTYFPNLDLSDEWQIKEEGEPLVNEDGTPYRYVTYERIKES